MIPIYVQKPNQPHRREHWANVDADASKGTVRKLCADFEIIDLKLIKEAGGPVWQVVVLTAR